MSTRVCYVSDSLATQSKLVATATTSVEVYSPLDVPDIFTFRKLLTDLKASPPQAIAFTEFDSLIDVAQKEFVDLAVSLPDDVAVQIYVTDYMKVVESARSKFIKLDVSPR